MTSLKLGLVTVALCVGATQAPHPASAFLALFGGLGIFLTVMSIFAEAQDE